MYVCVFTLLLLTNQGSTIPSNNNNTVILYNYVANNPVLDMAYWTTGKDQR